MKPKLDLLTFAAPKIDPVLHSRIRDTVAHAIESVLLSQWPGNVKRITDSHFILTVYDGKLEYRVRIEVKKC